MCIEKNIGSLLPSSIFQCMGFQNCSFTKTFTENTNLDTFKRDHKQPSKNYVYLIYIRRALIQRVLIELKIIREIMERKNRIVLGSR